MFNYLSDFFCLNVSPSSLPRIHVFATTKYETDASELQLRLQGRSSVATPSRSPKKSPMENDDKKTKSIFGRAHERAKEEEEEATASISQPIYMPARAVGGRAIKGRFSISDDFCKV